MSNQTYSNQTTPYFLPVDGCNSVSFVKQAAPPLAWANGNGQLYELNDGKLYFNGVDISTPSSGDVGGPGASTDNAVARFDGVTGKLLQNSIVTISDLGDLALSGLPLLTRPNATSQTVGINAGAAIGAVDSANTAIGSASLGVMSGATNNTAVGRNSGAAVTTGGNNTIVGSGSAVNLTTGSNNIVIGSGADSIATTASGQIVIGNSGSNVSDQIIIGSSQSGCTIAGIYSSVGDSTNFVTCTSGGVLGTNKLPWAYSGQMCSPGTIFNSLTQAFVPPNGGAIKQIATREECYHGCNFPFELTAIGGGALSSGVGQIIFTVIKNGATVGTPLIFDTVANVFTCDRINNAIPVSFAAGDKMQLQIDIAAGLLTTMKEVSWEILGTRN